MTLNAASGFGRDSSVQSGQHCKHHVEGMQGTQTAEIMQQNAELTCLDGALATIMSTPKVLAVRLLAVLVANF
jgi:hypothetical protein